MKIEIFKKRNNFKKKNFSINSNFYWKLSVFLSLAIIIGLFFFGYYLFNQTNQESTPQITTDSGQVPVVNKNRIEKVLNYFSDREEKSKEILNTGAPVVDPSL